MNSTTLEPVSAIIPEVISRNGKVVTTSVAVANYFHKRHDHVLDKIRSTMDECDPAYRLPNFRETFYHRENPKGGEGILTPMFELTRDAFVLIVMGFTGKKALQWKIDYINAFNKMEEELQRKHTTLFPLDADLFVEIRNGQTINVQQARPGECFMSLETSMVLAERAGYVVIHCNALEALTVTELAKRADTARREMHKWTKASA